MANKPRRFKDSPLFEITGKDTGKDTSKDTGKDTGKSTGNSNGNGNGNDAGNNTSTHTGNGNGNSAGNHTGKDASIGTGKDTGNFILTKKAANKQNVKLTVYIRPQQLRDLNDLQKESGRDKSDLTRIALDLLMEQVKIK